MTIILGFLCITLEFTKKNFNFFKIIFKEFLNLDYFLKLENMKLKLIVIGKNNVSVKL